MAIAWLRYPNKREYKDRFKEHGYQPTKIRDKYSRRGGIEIREFKKKFKEKFIKIKTTINSNFYIQIMIFILFTFIWD